MNSLLICACLIGVATAGSFSRYEERDDNWYGNRWNSGWYGENGNWGRNNWNNWNGNNGYGNNWMGNWYGNNWNNDAGYYRNNWNGNNWNNWYGNWNNDWNGGNGNYGENNWYGRNYYNNGNGNYNGFYNRFFGKTDSVLERVSITLRDVQRGKQNGNLDVSAARTQIASLLTNLQRLENDHTVPEDLLKSTIQSVVLVRDSLPDLTQHAQHSSHSVDRYAMADWISNTEKENVKRQLKSDEGDINKIYKDSLGFPTFGIGHRIKDTDPEHDKPLGTVISDERKYAAFDADLKDAIALTKAIYPCVEGWPSEVKEIMVNMVFNLGGKLRQFVKLGEALNARDWQKAADEMANSKWYGQVGKRAERLVARMGNVKN